MSKGATKTLFWANRGWGKSRIPIWAHSQAEANKKARNGRRI